MTTGLVRFDRTEQPTLAEEVEALERRRIIDALHDCGYVQAKAARVLGITPRQLGYKVRKYDIRLR